MKNSEMKTIIRHIDRLTRNLNARGRRRYADDATLDKAINDVRRYNDLIGRIADTIRFDSDSNERFAQLMTKRGIGAVKTNAEGLLKRECKDLVTHLKTLIKCCDIAIKATKGD